MPGPMQPYVRSPVQGVYSQEVQHGVVSPLTSPMNSEFSGAERGLSPEGSEVYHTGRFVPGTDSRWSTVANPEREIYELE
jgi:hypothetical protein